MLFLNILIKMYYAMNSLFLKSTPCESNEAKKSTFPRRMRRRERNLDKTSVGLYSSN